jgi:hypothetical protein
VILATNTSHKNSVLKFDKAHPENFSLLLSVFSPVEAHELDRQVARELAEGKAIDRYYYVYYEYVFHVYYLLQELTATATT